MIEGGIGGASTLTGLAFEKDTDLKYALEQRTDIKIDGEKVYKDDKHVGLLLQKYDLYKKFLDTRNVDWASIVSKRLLPDEAYFSLESNKLIIIEKKFQQIAGSVDEKLQTCGFKKRQYERLCAPLKNVQVEYVYVLNDWFTDKSYKDTLDYITDVGCKYYFNVLPLELLELD